MDDLLDLPEMDPALPEPDFFDPVENGVVIGSAGATISLQQNPPISSADQCLGLQPPPQIIFPNLGRSGGGGGGSLELKYDDESSEFDEFFVGGIPKLLDNLGSESNAGEGLQNAEEGEGNTQDEEETSACATESVEEEEDDRKSEGAKSSGPSTPDSRASAAVVRLSLPGIPKVSLDSRKRISVARESPAREESPQRAQPVSSASPPRQTRGRLNIPAPTPSKSSDVSSGPGKRKMSDSEDDVDEEDEESSILNRSSTTRSGRQTRKIARFGFEKGRKAPEEELVGGGKRSGRAGRNSDDNRRSSKKVERKEVVKQAKEQMDSDSGSDIFTPIQFPKKRSQYTIGSNGWIYYTDRVGKKTILKPPRVVFKRLGMDDVQQLKEKLVEDAARSMLLVEICIDNFRSAEEAVAGGARRIELCSSLAEGGLTPSSGFLVKVKERFPEIPVFVMIRPRGGDFVYSQDEIDIMKSDIEQLKQRGADGFVFGVLTQDHEVNDTACQDLTYAAYPNECTFHRAFDKVSDPIPALETIISIGFTRILTSGLKSTAKEGIPTLKRVVQAANNRIKIMAGAGINEKNVAEIVKKTGVHEVHGSASKTIPMSSLMVDQTPPATSKGKLGRRSGSKPPVVAMGSTDDSVIKITDSALVAQIVKLARP